MQRTKAQRSQAQNQLAQRQGKGASLELLQGERIAQLEALTDASPQAGRLAQLAAMANNSPRMAAQRKAISAIHNSPNVMTQRQQIDSLTGEIAQREEAEEPLQSKVAQREVAPAKPNNTGLPDNLKNGIKPLSGMSMNNVKIHYNSSQPAQFLSPIPISTHVQTKQFKPLPRPRASEEHHSSTPSSLVQLKSTGVIQMLMRADAFTQSIETIYDAGRSRSQKVVDFFFEKEAYTQNPAFTLIRNMLLDYHELGDRNDEETRKEKTVLLHHIEQEAYDWYATHKAQATISGNQPNPYHQPIIALLNDVRSERRTLTREIVANKDDIWVPGIESMSKGQKEQVQNLWKKLIGNKSRLKVTKSAAADQKGAVYADFLSLMSGKHGRDLLDRASRGNARNQSHVITINPSQGGEPAAEAHQEWNAQRQLNVGHPQYANWKAHQPVPLTKGQIRALPQGSGSGSTVPWRDAPATGDYYALGQNWDHANDTGDLELMPSFLVLGHELGHAVRQQHGRSTVAFQTSNHNTPQGAAWHNQEEQEVISGDENAIRAEHNLGKRKYHRALPL